LTDEDRISFLDDLDKSDVNVTEWEANFIDSVFERRQETFSDKQREAIDRMMKQYENKI
jgi:DNA-binding ferritin-like protein (Dps family)